MFFVAKYNPEPKRKINSINDVVSITIGLLILRCDEERKEKLLTCALEIEVEGRSLSVVFYPEKSVLSCSSLFQRGCSHLKVP